MWCTHNLKPMLLWEKCLVCVLVLNLDQLCRGTLANSLSHHPVTPIPQNGCMCTMFMFRAASMGPSSHTKHHVIQSARGSDQSYTQYKLTPTGAINTIRREV